MGSAVSDTVIRVAELTKRFGKVTAVDHLSFTVSRG
jgi:ABC-type branched-subunit amino acid transport system ATPase component